MYNKTATCDSQLLFFFKINDHRSVTCKRMKTVGKTVVDGNRNATGQNTNDKQTHAHNATVLSMCDMSATGDQQSRLQHMSFSLLFRSLGRKDQEAEAMPRMLHSVQGK